MDVIPNAQVSMVLTGIPFGPIELGITRLLGQAPSQPVIAAALAATLYVNPEAVKSDADALVAAKGETRSAKPSTALIFLTNIYSHPIFLSNYSELNNREHCILFLSFN
jgi:hypothetical protein